MADYAVQAANAGSAAIIAWMLDDNSHPNFSWGLWKNKKKGFKLRPWFYIWSLLCRYVPKGSVVYRVKQPSKNLRLMVVCAPAKGKDGSNGWTFCIVSRAKSPAKITLSIANGNILSMKHYLYSEQSAKVNKEGFPVPVATEEYDLGEGFDVLCPGNAVIFLTSLEY
jgi:hypothetical protein